MANRFQLFLCGGGINLDLDLDLDVSCPSNANACPRAPTIVKLHANVLFHPEECREPILCEVQFYTRRVYDLQHRQHLAYELRRARKLDEVVG